jgi:predicted RNase H-like HicB family nuclease
MAKITLNVEINEEADGSYWAEVQELPGCFASGFSMDELKEATMEAIQMWLPEGIVLEKAKWADVEDEKPKRRASKPKKRASAKRRMLVCA